MDSAKWAHIDLVLQVLFKHCAAGNDLETLLSLKQVCKLWNKIAKRILNENPHLIRWLEGGRTDYWDRSKHFTYFARRFPPACGLPVQIVVRQWTPALIQFFKDYSADIFSVHFRASELNLGQDSFTLPHLKHVRFEYEHPWNSYASRGCQDAIILLRDFIKSATLQTCHVFLHVRTGAIPESTAHLPMQMTSLSCDFEILENLVRGQHWPNLQKLEIKFRDGLGNYSGKFLEKVTGSLQTLHLDDLNGDPNQTLEIPRMPHLRNIELNDIVLVGNDVPQLLPSLQKVEILEFPAWAGVFPSLTQGGQPFRNVKYMKYTIDWNISVDELSRRMRSMGEVFPNLTHLNMTGSDTSLSATAHIVFLHLKNLESLQLTTRFNVWNDIVHMLTSRPRDDIPEDETTWTTALEGIEQNTILNLKNLKEMIIGIRLRNDVLPERESNFLFTAVLFRMKSLVHVEFPEFRVDSNQVKVDWERIRGRTLIDRSNSVRRRNI